MSQFKVGDKVKILFSSEFILIGKTGIVTETDYDTTVIDLGEELRHFHNRHNGRSFGPNRLKLAPDFWKDNWEDWHKRNPEYDLETIKRLTGERTW